MPMSRILFILIWALKRDYEFYLEWIMFVCAVDDSVYGWIKPKGFLFLVTLEASSCREE